jgi:GMP synthase (glutamine-hydrolysing)
VSEPGAPQSDPAILELGTPTLGICYGMQLMTHALGGTSARAAPRVRACHRHVLDGAPLFDDVPRRCKCGRATATSCGAPPGFEDRRTSRNAPVAAIQNRERRLFGILFHPEVVHTEKGDQILRNFAFDVCGCRGDWTMASFVDETVANIQKQVGDGKVVCGLSGGVDSTVAALLIHKAIGDRLTCIFVDNGLLRLDEAGQIRTRFERLKLPLDFVDATDLFLERLQGVTDPEQKRKIIGKAFIDVFETRAQALGGFDFLAQGTLYPDVIESVSVVGPSAVIKSHHNVGGLPERMQFKLVEPLRELFKDEVRAVGRRSGSTTSSCGASRSRAPGWPCADRPDHARAARSAAARRRGRRGRSAQGRLVPPAVAVVRGAAAGQSVGVMGDERTYEYTVGDPRGREPRRHDRRLGAPAARSARRDLVAHRQRGARHQSRRLRHQLEAAVDDRVGNERIPVPSASAHGVFPADGACRVGSSWTAPPTQDAGRRGHRARQSVLDRHVSDEAEARHQADPSGARCMSRRAIAPNDRVSRARPPITWCSLRDVRGLSAI